MRRQATQIGILTLGLSAALGVLATAIPAGLLAETSMKKTSGDSSDKILIRAKFAEGRKMRYNLKMSGAAAWTPHDKKLGWGKMNTDFTFDLATKVIRESSACTFHLAGRSLRSNVAGPKGRLAIVADRKKSKIRINDKWQAPVNKTPLSKPMTLTQGPLGGVRFTTGTLPIAIYLLPHVDTRFWGLLTAAPLRKVAVGEEWHDEFNLPVPGSKGRPLKLTGHWQVVGYRQYGGQRVLALTLGVDLDLKNSDVMLKNGDLIRVTQGSYWARGKALWDVNRGVLCYATADQKILIRSSGPKARALRSEHHCTLQLKSFK